VEKKGPCVDFDVYIQQENWFSWRENKHGPIKKKKQFSKKLRTTTSHMAKDFQSQEVPKKTS